MGLVMGLRFFLSSMMAAAVLSVSAQNKPTVFKLLPPANTGITFSNNLTENDSVNILNQANIYNGGIHYRPSIVNRGEEGKEIGSFMVKKLKTRIGS